MNKKIKNHLKSDENHESIIRSQISGKSLCLASEGTPNSKNPGTENYKRGSEYKKWGIHGGCSFNWKDKKILIIDQDELNCHMLSIFLRSTQVVTDCLFDPLKIKQYNHTKGNYDLILMEIYLCGLNGLELLEDIRDTDPHIPVIIQSVLAMPHNKQDCFDAGCTAFFTKPLDIGRLLGVMDGLMVKG